MNHSFSNLSAGCCRLIALAASLLLPAVSCTDETAERGGVTPPPETPSAGAIRFHSSAFDPKTATKTPVIDGNNITNFKVSANLPNPSDPGQTHAGKNSFNFFDGLNVLRVGGYWDYSPSMYWPNDTDTLSFYAYSPAGSVNLSGFVSHMYDFPAVDNAVMSYRVPHTPGPMADSVGTGALSPEDLLFAKVKWRESMGDTVPLIFRHALSIVTFAARNTTQDLDVTIQRIQLIHLKTRSTLDLSQDFTNDSVYWTPATEPADYVAGIPLQGDGSYAISLPPKGAQAQYISLTSPNEGMPVMPQGFPVYSGGGVSIITKPVVIDDINAPEPDQPGILVTYMARNSVQLVAPSGTRAFYPFPKLYKDPNYGGKPDLTGNPDLDAFAFQLGKRYQFTFDFDGSSYPRINFQTGNIPDFDDVNIQPLPPLLHLDNATDTVKIDTVSYERQTGVGGAKVLTNRSSWSAEVRSGEGWLNLNTLFGVNGDSLRYTVSENRGADSRLGYIVVHIDDVTDTLYVRQLAKTHAVAGQITTVNVTTASAGNYNFDMAFIPKGSFLSGTTTGTEITLTKDYYMGTTTVTNAQFAVFLNDLKIGQDGRLPNDSIGIYDAMVVNSGTSPWGVTWNGTAGKWEACTGQENFPVVYVTWYGATGYCDWLTTKGLGYSFALPTEAQWQNAAQCGTKHIYNGIADTWDDSYGWISTNSTNKTHAVGTATACTNLWNLKDMHGNVWEWCRDWYGAGTYPYPTATDPTGASATGSTSRVLRGGRWDYPSSNAASAARGSNAPASYSHGFGLRVVAMPQ